MTDTASHKTVYGILLFFAGVLLATGLTVVLTWASLEAEFYGFQRYSADERLSGFSCPALITPYETGSVSLKISNSTPKEITPIVRIDTSTASVPDSIQDQFTLQHGESKQLAQTISARNIDLGFFIFAKAFRYPAYPLPSAETTCGVMVVNLPLLSGAQIYAIWLALSLVLIPLGLWRWSTSASPDRPNQDARQNAVRALALVVLLGLFAGSQGLWLVGVLFLALTFLLAAAILRFVSAS